MKILLISPFVDLEMRREKGLMVPQLSLYILEGLTSPEHRVKIIEEETEDLNLDEDCDLVGISCMTSNAPRAYWLAEEFRKRGKTVVLGGVHPTILPDEALQYADCVVIGEAEGVWEKVLNDHRNGCLQRTYQDPDPDLTKYVPKNFKTDNKKRVFNALPLLTTKGCPYNCDFCSVSNLYGNKIRHIPVENVVHDITESGGKVFMFLDDNIIGHPKYAKELFRAIKPLKIKWVGQASISLTKDNEMLQLAADSGCKALLVGLESISESQMKIMRKSTKGIKELKLALKKIMRMGILIHGSIIFGFDSDTKEVFEKTVRFLSKNKISSVSFCILTPYPGTKTHENLKRERRLLTTDWRHYNNRTVVFNPKYMTPYELQLANLIAKKKFYRVISVLRRWSGNLTNSILHLALNYMYIKQVKSDARRLPKLKAELYL
jgi:radical SAM superfamily enzyme YgiQ (UPF0313 family)